jgi:hypothetical protein
LLGGAASALRGAALTASSKGLGEFIQLIRNSSSHPTYSLAT